MSRAHVSLSGHLGPSHSIVCCPKGHVIRQCRCATPNKPTMVSHETCRECEEEARVAALEAGP